MVTTPNSLLLLFLVVTLFRYVPRLFGLKLKPDESWVLALFIVFMIASATWAAVYLLGLG